MTTNKGHISDLSVLEDVVRRQSVKRRTEAAILGTVAIVGFVGVAILAPNAVRILQHIAPDMRPASQKQSVGRAIGRLIKQGLVERQKDGRGYVLTSEGHLRLMRLSRDGLSRGTVSKKRQAKRWDGQWRIVAFDISEKKRHKRDELRDLLVETGFVRLQHSVWVYPFRCDEVVALLKMHLSLGYTLTYVIAEAVENDVWLRKHYSLK